MSIKVWKCWFEINMYVIWMCLCVVYCKFIVMFLKYGMFCKGNKIGLV